MTDVEDKVRKLLARASHPNTPEEEARTSAHIAAKLMAEHKIDVAAVVTAPIDPSSRADVFRRAGVQLFFDLVTALTQQARDRAARETTPRPPPPEPTLDPEFWRRWEEMAQRRQRPVPTKSRRRSAQSRKTNPDKKRRRKP